jgi:NDP-sugar pyrophosphorylase family protein
MQAIIFSAGLGTRLKPLTDTMPKALVPIAGKPLLQWNIEKLIAAGCSLIVVNVHHFPDMIRDFLKKNDNFGITIRISDESGELLDTGGGLLRAAPLFRPGEPIIAHNVDVISHLELKTLIKFHSDNNPLATLVVRDRQTQRYLLFDNRMLLCGWMNKATGEVKQSGRLYDSHLIPFAFSGIQIISHEIFTLIEQRGRFSVIDAWLNLAAQNRIMGFVDNSGFWMDLGKQEQLEEARKMI